MLHSAPALVREAARRIAWLGADRVRITAGWSALAPARTARTRPGPPFDPSDSRTYPREPWIRLDRAVKAAKSAGLDVMLDVAFWAPRWAVKRAVKPADRQTWAPDAAQFGHFAAAVARRYDGSFPDPERPGDALPDVRMYTTWNEPNSTTFLRPQWIRRRGRWQAESAAHLPGDAQRGLRRDQGAVGAQPRARGRHGGVGLASARPRRGGAAALPARARLRRRQPGPAEHSRVSRLPAPARRRLVPSSVLGRDHSRRRRTPTPTTRRWPTPGASRACSGPWPTAAGWRGASRCTRRSTGTRRTRPTRRRATGRWSRPASSAGPPTWRGATPAPGCSPSSCCATSIQRDPRRRTGTRVERIPDRAVLRRRHAEAGRAGLPDALLGAGPGRRAASHRCCCSAACVPRDGPVVLRVERRGGEADAWHPVEVTGERCDSNGPAFIADPSGWFLRAAPYTGPAEYRLSRLLPSGSWESGIALPVAAGSALR